MNRNHIIKKILREGLNLQKKSRPDHPRITELLNINGSRPEIKAFEQHPIDNWKELSIEYINSKGVKNTGTLEQLQEIYFIYKNNFWYIYGGSGDLMVHYVDGYKDIEVLNTDNDTRTTTRYDNFMTVLSKWVQNNYNLRYWGVEFFHDRIEDVPIDDMESVATIFLYDGIFYQSDGYNIYKAIVDPFYPKTSQ